MQELTIKVTDELEVAIERYRRVHDDQRPTEDIVVAALQEFVRTAPDFEYRGPFTITVAEVGSGDPHGSRDHDRILADMGRIHG